MTKLYVLETIKPHPNFLISFMNNILHGITSLCYNYIYLFILDVHMIKSVGLNVSAIQENVHSKIASVWASPC